MPASAGAIVIDVVPSAAGLAAERAAPEPASDDGLDEAPDDDGLEDASDDYGVGLGDAVAAPVGRARPTATRADAAAARRAEAGFMGGVPRGSVEPGAVRV